MGLVSRTGPDSFFSSSPTADGKSYKETADLLLDNQKLKVSRLYSVELRTPRSSVGSSLAEAR